MPRAPRASRAALVLATGLTAVTLSGCSAVDTGQAAVSDTFRISQATVEGQVREVLTGLDQPPGTPPDGLASAVTQRLVQKELIASKAIEMDVAVTPAEIEAAEAQLASANGGEEALLQAALQAGIPASTLPDVVRTNLLIDKLSAKLTASGGQSLQELIVAYSQDLHVQVAPRYGDWSPESLSIVPDTTLVRPSGESTDSVQ